MSEETTRPADFDDQQPHEEDSARVQLQALRSLLTPSKRVLDLGCGAGRVLVPLARDGHEMIGVDRDRAALEECRRRLDAAGCEAALHESDVLDAPLPDGPFDAVLCLGNLFMLLADVEHAVALLRSSAAALTPGGAFVMDDCPADLWPEVTAGNWLAGISDDGEAQLVWDDSDAVFALRYGRDVDPETPHLTTADRRMRMWTDGALRLAARAGGLSAPRRVHDGLLLVMRRPDGGDRADCGEAI